MSDTLKAAVITGIITLVVGFFGGRTMLSNQQNLTIQVDGQSVTVTPQKYQELQESVRTLTEENNRLKAMREDSSAEVVSGQAVMNKKNYLVYLLEPYAQKGYTKVTDNSMKIAGKEYTDGFQLKTGYTTANCIFNLEGKYTSVSGIIGCDDDNEEETVAVEFFGDNVLIDTIVVEKNELPGTFSVDVTGVSKFEIALPQCPYAKVDFSDVKLQ